MSLTLAPAALEAANAHAMRDYPNESCGLIVDGEYMACYNYAQLPEQDFAIASEIWAKLAATGRKVEAVVHSHPDGPIYPSERDMQGQLATAVPWVIIPTNGEECAAPTIWGDRVAPILGREFLHGVTDCYSLIQDVFALGRDALAEQGIDWPFAPMTLPSFPRNDAWWADQKDGTAGDDLYVKNFESAGFVKIPRENPQPGDCFLCSIHSKQTNHAGVLLSDGTILHHLPKRVSRREPAGIWAYAADFWVRPVKAVDLRPKEAADGAS